MNRAAFDLSVETPLAPTLHKGDVVILDNLAVHKSPKVAACLKQKGAWFLFLPPYSPDLDPIEMAFSKLKAHPSKAAARTFDTLWRAISDICGLFDPDEYWNFLKAAGKPHDRHQIKSPMLQRGWRKDQEAHESSNSLSIIK